MSDEKKHTQQSQAHTPADSLDAQYKPIGLSAVSAAATAAKAPKVKMPDKEQMG